MKNQFVGSNKKAEVRLAASLMVLILLLGGLSGCGFLAGAGNVLTQALSEPLGGATSAKFDIYAGSGNLTIDPLSGGEQLLASGTLQYTENLGQPTRTLDTNNGQATLALKWAEAKASCGAAIEWLIHLNPTVPSDLTARSGGGNVKLNLAGMAVTRLATETGGGNLEVALPEGAADLNVTAKTGGGNITVEIGSGTTGSNTIVANSGAGTVAVTVPSGMAARIQATTGIGTVIVDSRFTKIDDKTYQSPDYDTAANKAEITLNSGAGNVEVNSK
jgi:hypothetical protein